MARIEPVHWSILGWEIRPNICTAVGDVIDFHVHSHDHLSLVWRGRWKVTEISPDGEETERFLASCGLGGGVEESRIPILAGWKHRFDVLELEGGVAVLECLWPEGVK